MTLCKTVCKGVVQTIDHFAKNYALSANERERSETDYHVEEFIKTLPIPSSDVQAVRNFYRHLKLDYLAESKAAGIRPGV
jgi:hypothetical protein